MLVVKKKMNALVASKFYDLFKNFETFSNKFIIPWIISRGIGRFGTLQRKSRKRRRSQIEKEDKREADELKEKSSKKDKLIEDLKLHIDDFERENKLYEGPKQTCQAVRTRNNRH